ncbi:hypothetical protein PGT21_032818 [Puccinia graminis f. sp. tritici]|uniref:Uncharacterized protein n=1 Tax=Puccinia graminis f. sp. tritici TaxID=56615 RepID=A0A5B0MGM1_PUCGR|nr:hypothetical protein PGT21_032818 [Puccinia graminis f. sp. tritici]
MVNAKYIIMSISLLCLGTKVTSSMVDIHGIASAADHLPTTALAEADPPCKHSPVKKCEACHQCVKCKPRHCTTT